MSDYREECVRHKNVQRGIEDERPVSGKKKVGRKPFLIESFMLGRWDWNGRYATLEVAQQALGNFSRKHPSWGWRLLRNGETLQSFTPETKP